MKKASRNLVLRSETLRTLASIDLVSVAGGGESSDKQCPKAIAFESGDFQCPRRAIVAPGAGG